MLDSDLKAQLKGYLENLKRSVVLRASVDDSPASSEMLALLNDVASVSPKVKVEVWRDDAERKPSFAIATPGQDITLRFAGLPMGHEFTSLVLALLHVGGHPMKVDPELMDQVRQLEGPLHFETYFSQSCQNCPELVQALNMAAVLNSSITHESIDGALFQEEVEAREVLSVPTVFLNGKVFGQGRMGLEEIASKLDAGASDKRARAIQNKDAFDVLVVGGGPAGAAAAIYTARKGVRTGIVAERFGGQVLDTLSIENLISVPYTEGPKLAAALEQHVGEYDVDVMNLLQARQLLPTGEDGLLRVELENGATVRSRAVVLSTGARWRQLGVPGENEYRNKGVAYCPHCDGPLFKGKRVAVIGGGNSGVEAAIDLAGLVEHVTVIEFDSVLRADAVLQDKLKSLSNVSVLVNAKTTAIEGDGKRVHRLLYEDRVSGDSHALELEGVFVQIGLIPNTDWLKGTLELNKHGEVVVDDRAQTSLPGVFAAGDCTTTPYKQIVVAMGQGATAGLSAFDYLIRSS